MTGSPLVGAGRPLVLTNTQLSELKVATVVLDALEDTEAEAETAARGAAGSG